MVENIEQLFLGKMRGNILYILVKKFFIGGVGSWRLNEGRILGF